LTATFLTNAESRWKDFAQGRSAALRARECEKSEESATGARFRQELGRELASAVTSVSHAKYAASRSLVLVVGLGLATGEGDTEVLAVGVDLERADREVSVALERKLVSTWERAFDLSLLEHWVIKEACFKATPKNEGMVLSQFEIAWYDSEKREGEVLGPIKSRNSRCRFSLLRDENWVAAFAITDTLRSNR
jgi:phosphopantetheinyl transferase (holo-ACP synthase)